MENFIRKMNTVAINQIGMIGEDMEHTQWIENLAFDLIYWTKCLDWSILGDDMIINEFNDKQKEQLSKVDDEFIDDMWDYVKWERTKPFVVETDEITRIIIDFLTYKEGLK